MIAANELRIGNWVIDRHGNRIACTGVTICGVEYGDSPIEPIPLTPEILEKAGFEADTFPVDFYGGHGSFSVGDVIPTESGLVAWSLLIHEITGYVIYSLMGYV